MPLHLHFASPPKPDLDPKPQRRELGFAVAAISTCLAVLAATYWFLAR
jgi:hypothetical protein